MAGLVKAGPTRTAQVALESLPSPKSVENPRLEPPCRAAALRPGGVAGRPARWPGPPRRQPRRARRTPGRMISGMPPARVATTGVPQTPASMSTSPKTRLGTHGRAPWQTPGASGGPRFCGWFSRTRPAHPDLSSRQDRAGQPARCHQGAAGQQTRLRVGMGDWRSERRRQHKV